MRSGSTVILFLLAINGSAQDLKVLRKDHSVVEISFVGKTPLAIITKSGEIPYREIDTVYILAANNVPLRDLAYKVPVVLNGMQLRVKDLFIEDLPFTNGGELLFEKRLDNRGSKSIMQVAAQLNNSNRVIETLTRDNAHWKCHIHEGMTTYTRTGEPLAYEETKMGYDVSIELDADSISIKISVGDFTLYAYQNSFNKVNVKATKTYYPAEMFLKTNYYVSKGRKPKKRNLIYKEDVIRIVHGIYAAINQ